MGNAYQIAQLELSAPETVAAARVVKLTKPAGDQAIAVRIDGTSQVDFSEISGEPLTLVHVGDRLVILFNNNSTIWLPSFYGTDGHQRPDVSVAVGADRSVTAKEFASLFPVTNDPSILPTANDPSAPASSAHFETSVVDQIVSAWSATSLLSDMTEPGVSPFAPGIPDAPRPNDIATATEAESGTAPVNHAPVIHPEAPNFDVGKTLVAVEADLTASGHVVFSDVDTGDTPTATVTGLTSGDVVLTDEQRETFTDAFDIDAVTGAWSFDLPAAYSHYLTGRDQQLHLIYTVTVADHAGATVTQDVTITLIGAANLALGQNGDDELGIGGEHDLLIGDFGGGHPAAPSGLADAGSDIIIGSTRGDLIFGDVLFTDALAAQMGMGVNLGLPQGSGWEVFAQLEAGAVASDPTWDRADTLAYIETHMTELSAESGRAGGNDFIFAGEGNDIVFGQEGNDHIDGGDGDDTLVGGSGEDNLIGGEGVDRFVFTDLGAVDRVFDYEANETLDLSALLNAGFTTGQDAANFVRLQTDGTDVKVQVDIDGAAGGANWTDVVVLFGYNTAGNQVQVEFENQARQLAVA